MGKKMELNTLGAYSGTRDILAHIIVRVCGWALQLLQIFYYMQLHKRASKKARDIRMKLIYATIKTK